MVALDESNAGSGAFGTPPSGIQVTSLNDIDYAEQSSRSSSPTFEIEWTAPGAGSGPISFYAAGNAVNGNFGITGDQPDTTSLTISEAGSTSLFDVTASINLQIVPNPVQDLFKVNWSSQDFVPQRLHLVNLVGQSLIEKSLTDNQTSVELNIADYPAGVYFIHMSSNDRLETKKLIKN